MAFRNSSEQNISNWSKKKLQETIKKKNACNMKAQKIVESLIDGKVEPDQLLPQLKFINKCHYEDIVIERAIGKICGYPLCDNVLTNILNQKYHICLSEKKVYDLTDRKHFCSDQCFKCSEYLKEQLQTSPLWSRDMELAPQFRLLSANGHGVDQESTSALVKELKVRAAKEGINSVVEELQQKIDEIDQLLGRESETSVQNTDQNTSFLSNNNSNSDENLINNSKIGNLETEIGSIKNFATNKSINQLDSKEKSKNLIMIKIPDYLANNSNNRLPNSNNNSNINFSSMDNVKDSKKNSEVSNEMIKIKSLSKNVGTPVDPFKESAYRIEKCFTEWFTIDSLCYILGEDRICKSGQNLSLGLGMYDKKYLQICKKLNVLEIEDENYDRMTEEGGMEDLFPSKPIPDYAVLQKDANNMELKVRAFFNGNMRVPSLDEKLDQSSDTASGPLIMPHLHQHGQTSIRRDIVLNKLKNILSALASELGFNLIEVTEQTKRLIHTFTLSAHNINFKPSEWTLIIIIILKLLSKRDDNIERCLTSKSGRNYLSLISSTWKLKSDYFDLFCCTIIQLNSTTIENNNSLKITNTT